MPREAISYCRICSGGCGMRLTIGDDETIQSIRGDRDNPVSRGYACFKGLQAAESHQGPRRLLHPLKRMPDGSFARIGLEDALDEIAAKLAVAIDRHGPEAAACFNGNGALFNHLAFVAQKDFLRAIGSSQFYTTITIDQPAKFVSAGRLGAWTAGLRAFSDMDVCLIIGANPLVSHGQLGILWVDPTKRLKEAKANGLKLIVVDPRQTETARYADLALQPYPGEDVAIAAGLIRLILAEGWEDKGFCDRYVGQDRMARLREVVAPFTESYVETRAGLQPGDLRKVAEMFGRDGRTGAAVCATGTDMAPYSNTAQHLIDSLNVICGRFLRAGDRLHAVDPFLPLPELREGLVPMNRPWEAGGKSRIRGFNDLNGERLSATLADEILTPGEGQIRALIVDGGNPLTSLPDQVRATRAFESLDLLVAIDPWHTPTTRLAHYILPPRMQYERPDLPYRIVPGLPLFPGAWIQYTPAVVAPPAGSEVTDDWYVFWSLAKRLGKTLVCDGIRELPMDAPPTSDELLAICLSNARTSLDALRNHPHGHDLGLDGATVRPGSNEDTRRFDVAPDDVAAEVARYLSTSPVHGAWTRDGGTFSHLLSSRRMRDFFNSNGTSVESVLARHPTNPAYMSPADLTALGVAPGDVVELISSHGRIRAIAEADPDLRSGVVSIAHGWGALPGEDEDPVVTGTCVNRLFPADRHYEDICAMPHMSAVPVNVVPVAIG